MDERKERKQRFVTALAEYLAGDQAEKSIRLAMKDPNAIQWAALRGKTPLFGWPTVAEAEQQLGEWLGIEMPKPKRAKKVQARP